MNIILSNIIVFNIKLFIYLLISYSVYIQFKDDEKRKKCTKSINILNIVHDNYNARTYCECYNN